MVVKDHGNGVEEGMEWFCKEIWVLRVDEYDISLSLLMYSEGRLNVKTIFAHETWLFILVPRGKLLVIIRAHVLTLEHHWARFHFAVSRVIAIHSFLFWRLFFRLGVLHLGCLVVASGLFTSLIIFVRVQVPILNSSSSPSSDSSTSSSKRKTWLRLADSSQACPRGSYP